MALTKMTDDVITGLTNIGEDTDAHGGTLNDEGVRIAGIVKFRKCSHGKVADTHRGIRTETEDKIFPDIQASITQGLGSDINRQRVFFRKCGNAMNVIAMLVRDKNGLDLLR